MTENKTWDVKKEVSLHSQMYNILHLIKTREVTIKPRVASDFNDAKCIAESLSSVEICEELGADFSNENTHEVVNAYNGLLSRGAIIPNNNSVNKENLEKENEELKIQLDAEKKMRYMAEGRLEEYRRKYEDGVTDTFTSEVTDDEST